jgi:hypothetical protein
MVDSTGNAAPIATPSGGGKKKMSLLKIGGLGIIGIVVVMFVLVIGAACCAAFVFQLGGNTVGETDHGVTYTPTTVPAAGQSTVIPTAKPTATPKPTPAPTMTPDEIKASAHVVSYRELLTNPLDHVGEMVMVKGRVTQVIKGNGDITYLIDTDDGFDSQLVMVWFDGTSNPVMEGDTFTVYGEAHGTYTYTTVLGAEKEVPYIEYETGSYSEAK